MFGEEIGKKVNLIVTCGGDGTILFAAKLYSQEECPPLVSFGLGSMGYLCSFEKSEYREVLDSIFTPPEAEYDPVEEESKGVIPCLMNRDRIQINLDNEEERDIHISMLPECPKKMKIKNLHALNEITIERGASSFMTNIDAYINGNYFTTIQADGLIIATSTGSTAYNLSAGGPICHNRVNSIILTAVSPHTLSFRPVIFPDTCKISIKISED